ncbi:diiron oxygenase [Polyangium sp. y55x31]|uniref:diiron oxygenase n=1 Tax=Polyangium sp. y55x31 TaxID=3042688 RepID=UPI0024828C75|nr:diiron oxygenase [Polyangium sp. y55x31]MDI1480361.1 diiron oxygenase [Polyangium sp. y55x31]
MNTPPNLVEKLVALSRKHARDPYTYIDWPEELDPDAWYTSPELSSLWGTEAWERMTEAQRKRLAFLESVNFFSLNIHGEKALMEGLAARLYASQDARVTAYLHHFLDEENKHSVIFGEFCMRYAGKLYPDRKIALPQRGDALERDLLFFAKVLVFEELADAHNQAMALDERLHGVARVINAHHHYEEARHLAFGRHVVRDLARRSAQHWPDTKRRELSDYMTAYLDATWREYYQIDVYRDLGLEDPWGTLEAAWDAEAQRERRRRMSRKSVQCLQQNGILLEESRS